MDAPFLTQILTFIAGLVILIIVHELGHFAAARLLKVGVDEFGLGFPPRVAKLFRLGETDYTINAIPLGGFVRLRGENDPTVEGGFMAASPWVRLGVLFAGPFANLLTGLVLAVFLFYSVGQPIENQVIIRGVSQDSPAEQAGLQVGDLFLEVNGVAIDSIETLQAEIAASLDQPTMVIVQRDGQSIQVTLVPRSSPPPGQAAIGVALGNPTEPVSISSAIASGSGEFSRVVSAFTSLPGQLIRGELSPEEGRLVGYRGMFEIYQQIPSPVWFFMMISISLGILNLLPIPALDGGRILLTLPEIIFRRRIPAQYENMIHLVGFVVLIILMIYINIQDFINPIQLPQ